MLPSKLAFVDIETTGARSHFDRVLEIGIVRVENDQVIRTYSQLINPQRHIPPEIELLTGITSRDIENAPTFRQVSDEILELLDDAVFVAHNVRFDYGFLKSEYKRLNKTFTTKHFCTVRLSRTLFPNLAHHNLDSIIRHFNLNCEKRHRALDDAKVIYDFYTTVKKSHPEELFLQAMKTVLRKPYLPIKLDEKTLENIPEEPGVYIFYGPEPDGTSSKTASKTGIIGTHSLQNIKVKNHVPLYIGKSINIKERVLSHFSGDIHSPLEMKIAQQVESIETITTAGELGALFLESHLVKKLLPLFNKQLRQKKELIALKTSTNKEGYLTIVMEILQNPPVSELDSYVGFFKSRKQAKDFLSRMSLEHTLCEKLLGTEKTSTSCFGYRLERCKGACIQKEHVLSYNLRFTEAFSKMKIKAWPFPGPIIITEKNELDGKTEHFIVDKWCYLGSVSTDEFGSFYEKQYEYAFDVDTYKILIRFLMKETNTKSIRVISNTSYASLNV